MKTYFTNIKILSYQILIVLGLFFISRVLFYFFNLSSFNQSDTLDILIAFFVGFRFDLSTILLFNLPVVIFMLIPGKHIHNLIAFRIIKLYLIVINGVLLFSNLSDIFYFEYIGERSTSDTLKWMMDTNDFFALLPRYIMDYWLIIVLLAIFLIVTWKILPKVPNTKYLKSGWKKRLLQLLISLILLIFTFFGIRGFNPRPISVIDAADYVPPELIPLTINTPYSIIHTLNNEALEEKNYFSDKQLRKIYSPIHVFNKNKPPQKKNVFIIVLEGFSYEYTHPFKGESYAPFLYELSKKGKFYSYGIANAKRSIEAIPAIFSSLPSLMDDSYLNSVYNTNKINSLASTLSKHDYYTAFFHGSTNGSMKFDTYTRLAGFKDYFGRTEYGNDAHYDGNWGIYDEYFMNYTAEKLKECPKPFMAGLFTLSSHHPYLIPENTLKKIPQEEDMFLTAIRYTDYCLKNFFQSIENESWYNNTLFIIVADHTTVTRCNYSTNYIGKYRIPFLFYCPSDSALKGKSDSLVQQLDIYPSVIDYLGINDTILAYGSSIFEKSKYKYCINYLSSMYVGYKDSCLLSFDGEQMHGFYEYKNDSMLQKNFKKYDHPLKEELFNATKAIIQDYNHRLINNQLTPDND